VSAKIVVTGFSTRVLKAKKNLIATSSTKLSAFGNNITPKRAKAKTSIIASQLSSSQIPF